jgi:Tfp pilus assembly protein PilZ
MDGDGERRKHHRYDVTRRCWCETPGTTMYVSMLNVGHGGTFLQTARPLAVGQRALLRWRQDDGSEVQVEAQVVWNHDGMAGGPPGMGLEFGSFRLGEDGFGRYISTFEPV